MINKKNEPKTIPFREMLSDYYKQDPTAKARIEAGSQKIITRMKLKEARRKANLSQAELAKRSGVNQDKISRIENGEYNPTIYTLQKIAVGMGKTLEIRII